MNAIRQYSVRQIQSHVFLNFILFVLFRKEIFHEDIIYRIDIIFSVKFSTKLILRKFVQKFSQCISKALEYNWGVKFCTFGFGTYGIWWFKFQILIKKCVQSKCQNERRFRVNLFFLPQTNKEWLIQIIEFQKHQFI